MPFLKSLTIHPLEDAPGSLLRTTGHPIEAKTLGEALFQAGRLLNVRFEAHEPPKYFRIYGIPGWGDKFILVDVHIIRNGTEICPKQDLEFPVLESDIVCVALLGC